MPIIEKPVEHLSGYIACVSKLRQSWGLAGPKNQHKELWFRGESRDYGETILRPELYRAAGTDVSLKRVLKLLDIENDLHDEFQRAADERYGGRISEQNWDWDSYFLMQHDEGPTRLLDWSDGALMALHFAVRNRADDSEDARVYVLEPYTLSKDLDNLSETKRFENRWKAYVRKHRSYGLNEDNWEDGYLPADEDANQELKVPRPPVVLDFPLITRRIAAQRAVTPRNSSSSAGVGAAVLM
jgi:FRG domain